MVNVAGFTTFGIADQLLQSLGYADDFTLSGQEHQDRTLVMGQRILHTGIEIPQPGAVADTMAAVLKEMAKKGVRVLFVLDAFGAVAGEQAESSEELDRLSARERVQTPDATDHER